MVFLKSTHIDLFIWILFQMQHHAIYVLTPVAHIHLDVFKAKLLRLCDIGVLEKCGASQWASPTFIIPKKDGSV